MLQNCHVNCLKTFLFVQNHCAMSAYFTTKYMCYGNVLQKMYHAVSQASCIEHNKVKEKLYDVKI